MTTITLNKHHNTGIITINNPPVNALSQKVREDLVRLIDYLPSIIMITYKVIFA